MDFPADPPAPAEAPVGLAEALGARPLSVARGRYDYVVEVADEAVVRDLAPDLRFLATLSVRGTIVTAAGAPDGPHDFVSRFFAPGAGVDEDPVTGSAHCVLAPFWTAKFGARPLQAYQASQRGGGMRVELVGDRVLLAGHAATVLEGQLLAAAT
jgi:predicted PhzF superfamily epimerase YddE/YHI9